MDEVDKLFNDVNSYMKLKNTSLGGELEANKKHYILLKS